MAITISCERPAPTISRTSAFVSGLAVTCGACDVLTSCEAITALLWTRPKVRTKTVEKKRLIPGSIRTSVLSASNLATNFSFCKGFWSGIFENWRCKRWQRLVAQGDTLLDESNRLWVPLSLGFGIVFSVVAAMKHDSRGLLWLAAPCFIIAFWRILASCKIPILATDS